MTDLQRSLIRIQLEAFNRIRPSELNFDAFSEHVNSVTQLADGWDWTEAFMSMSRTLTPAQLEQACTYGPIEPVYDVYGVSERGPITW
jgi:hypothetical protein